MATLPKCPYANHADCFARHNAIGHENLCVVLTDATFRGKNRKQRDCPFYKSVDDYDMKKAMEEMQLYNRSHSK